jgi:hypothetical protein
MTPNWKWILGGGLVAAVVYFIVKPKNGFIAPDDNDLRPEYKGKWVEQGETDVLHSLVKNRTVLLAPIHTGLDRIQEWLRAQRLPELPADLVTKGYNGRFVADPASAPVTFVLFQKVGETKFYIVANTVGNAATQDALELPGEISQAYFNTRNRWFRLNAAV